MGEVVLGFFENLFGSSYLGRCAVVFFLSLLPAAGGPTMIIPIGAVLGLPAIPNALSAIIGNCLPAPFIILFIRKIFAWMRTVSKSLGRLADKFEIKAQTRGKGFRHGMFIGLMLFVAIPLPLPGMGAWTGSLIAALFDIRLKIALPAIGIGVIISAVIATSVTYGLISLVL